MAALCLEKLIALGARKIILYGWCGSLVPSLQVGDLLVPNKAISDEGTSKHYINSNTIEVDDVFCSDLESCFIKQSMAYKKGPVWTTDAPYRETREKVAGFAEQAVLGVDMEFAALCAVAFYRKVQLAGLMLVSDELWKDPWEPHFGDKKFKNRSRQLVEILSTWLNK
jgi:uridine phosphorylase